MMNIPFIFLDVIRYSYVDSMDTTPRGHGTGITGSEIRAECMIRLQTDQKSSNREILIGLLK